MLFRPNRQHSDVPGAPGAPGWRLLSVMLVLPGLLALMLLPERAGEGADDPPPQLAAPAPEPSEQRAQPPAAAQLPAQDERAADERPAARNPLWTSPGFRVARVRRGERVPVYERPGRGLVERVRDETEFGSPQVFGVVDRRGGWLEVSSPISPDNRTLWIPADRRRLRFATTRLSVRVDLGSRTAELRRGGKVERRFTVTVGAAASSTPTGRFAVTDTFTEGLNPVYGCCAIALSARQTNLPPGWIGGDRVAIHGTTGPVGAAASNGCIRATNEDAMALLETLPLGAPVFISR